MCVPEGKCKASDLNSLLSTHNMEYMVATYALKDGTEHSLNTRNYAKCKSGYVHPSKATLVHVSCVTNSNNEPHGL